MEESRVLQIFRNAILEDDFTTVREILLDGIEEIIRHEDKITVACQLISKRIYDGLEGFARDDNKIQGIKYLRERNLGLGLKEAKDVADAYWFQNANIVGTSRHQ